MIPKSYFCIQEQWTSIKRGWHLPVNTGMMAGKSVTYYGKARIRNERQQQVGQQPHNSISSDDQRAVILSRVLLARIPSPFLPPPPPHSFLSFLFRNTIRSNKQAVGNKDSLILPFKHKCQRLLLLFPGRLKGSEWVHATQRWALPAPYLPRKLPIKPPFHTHKYPAPPFSSSVFFFFFFSAPSFKDSLSGSGTSEPFPSAKGSHSGPGNASGGLFLYLIALSAPQDKAFNAAL